MSINIDELKKMMGTPSVPKTITPAKPTDTAPDFELDDDGEEYMGVGVDGVLASTEKLLAINRGLVDPDERDSLRYQKVLRPHSMLRESIKMDAGKVARTAMYQAAKRRNLQGMQPFAFDSYVERMLIGNPLTSPLEEINPMQLVESARRMTKMGPGGLGSSRSITEEAQNVNPSQFGFVSPIEGPECLVARDNAMLLGKRDWIYLESVTVEDELACNINGIIEYHKPERVIHEYYEGPLYVISNKHINMSVTPGHRVYYYDAAHKDPVITTIKELYERTDVTEIQFLCVAAPFVYTVRRSDISITSNYKGIVHCATVPGGLLYCKSDKCQPHWTGNSEKAGIDVRVAWGAKLGSNGRLYQKFFDKRKQKYRWMSPDDIADLTVKVPD